MTQEEFQEFVAQDAHVAGPLGRAARKMQPARFGLPTEAALVVVLFPLVQYMLTKFGLPWLSELRRYSEVQRRRVHEWIDEHYREHGYDPDAAEAASDALVDELEATTDAQSRQSWEKLAGLLKADPRSSG